jgi:DNA-binding transcriptional MerR regulator
MPHSVAKSVLDLDPNVTAHSGDVHRPEPPGPTPPAPPDGLTPTDRLLSIGAFARRSRLSPRALRLYERLGLLRPVQVERDNGYRRYHEHQLATAHLIAELRRLDMPLAQVATVLAALGPDVAEVTRVLGPDNGPVATGDGAAADRPRAAELLAGYWAEVERRVAIQRELAAHLQVRMASHEEGSVLRVSMFDVAEREVPEQLVLTEQRHVRIQEMPGWLPAAIGRVTAAAEGHGGAAGALFVIYHGEVNQDSDGPVEVCVPVGAQDEAQDVAMRREAAHREAYVRITKAQWEFPQILSAYDAVSQWIQAKGQQMAGSPREVYLRDARAAAPTDEVCDVAFPIA